MCVCVYMRVSDCVCSRPTECYSRYMQVGVSLLIYTLVHRLGEPISDINQLHRKCTEELDTDFLTESQSDLECVFVCVK